MTDSRAFMTQGFRARVARAKPDAREPKPVRFEHWVEYGKRAMYCTKDLVTGEISKEPIYKQGVPIVTN